MFGCCLSNVHQSEFLKSRNSSQVINEYTHIGPSYNPCCYLLHHLILKNPHSVIAKRLGQGFYCVVVHLYVAATMHLLGCLLQMHQNPTLCITMCHGYKGFLTQYSNISSFGQ